MEKKYTFANGIFLKKIGNYGDVKLTIRLDQLLSEQNNFNDDGWGNFIIRTSREGQPYCIVDEYKPKIEKREEQAQVNDNDVNLPF